MKHWTKFLPEAGRRITYKGDDQEVALDKIEILERQIKLMREQYDLQEKSILMDAKTDWTEDEIKEAKLSALEHYKNSK